jgi:hypothetical protein
MNNEQIERIAVLGSGVISVLEAAYQSLLGKKVILVTSDGMLGGAWGPLSLPEHSITTEKGVHYILEYEKTALALTQIFGKTERLKNKFRINYLNEGTVTYVPNLKNNIYPQKGVIDLYARLKNFLEAGSSNVELVIRKIECIKRSQEGNLVLLLKNSNSVVDEVKVDEIIFTSGLTGVSFESKGENIAIPPHPEGKRLRSHVYFYIPKVGTRVFDQCICESSPLIKYIHDVSKYSIGVEESMRLIVVSLVNNIRLNSLNIQELALHIENLDICSRNEIKYLYSFEIFLAEIDKIAGNYLAAKMGRGLSYIDTEDFGKSLSDNYEKYIDVFRRSGLI